MYSSGIGSRIPESPIRSAQHHILGTQERLENRDSSPVVMTCDIPNYFTLSSFPHEPHILGTQERPQNTSPVVVTGDIPNDPSLSSFPHEPHILGTQERLENRDSIPVLMTGDIPNDPSLSSSPVVYVDGEGRIRMRSETYPVEPNTPFLYARSISGTH
jgi:hypothetical protein